MSILVKQVVGELYILEENSLSHPLNPGSRRVRMHVKAAVFVRLGLAGDAPFGVVEFVSVVVGRYDVHQQYILVLRLQVGYAYFKPGKHAPFILETIIFNSLGQIDLCINFFYRPHFVIIISVPIEANSCHNLRLSSLT